MRRFFYMLLVSTGIALGAAEEIPSAFKENSQWKPDAAGVIRYVHQNNWVPADLLFQAEGGNYYRVSFEGKCEGVPLARLEVIRRNGDHTQYFGIRVTPEWNRSSACFYVKNSGEVSLSFVFNKKHDPCKLEVRDFKIEKLSESDLANNVFPQGDFENAAGMCPDFMSGINDPVSSPVRENTGFPSGRKSAAMLLNTAEKSFLNSTSPLPFVPESECEVSFWAKAEKKCTMGLTIDFCHKVAQRRNFELDEEWRPYLFRVKAPALAENKDLEGRFCLINLVPAKQQAGNTVYIDDLRFIPVAKSEKP